MIRVRIAPSPTGPLHIGTARTALFNRLFAKKHGGSFILRIEDTDLERSDLKWEKDIIRNLLWLGIKWDEGITRARDKKYIGDFGPYRQSERLKGYTKYIEKLLRADKAYHCFCTEEELEAMRQEQMSRGEAPRYSGRCREFPESEVKKRLATGQSSIIRFKVLAKKVVFHDLIRGKIEFDVGLIGDIAVAKDPATPLYNFAVVVDDFEMEITHVIRGEDHISNTPKQILIQEALGFPQPKYAHLPLILGSDRSKLSKRHGVISISEYRKEGYLPEALVNFMAFLGWNPGTEKEIYSMEELIKDFSLEKIQKAGAVFNIQKLDHINGVYIRNKSAKELTELCTPYWRAAGFIEETQSEKRKTKSGNSKFKIIKTNEIVDPGYLERIIALYQERLKKLSEIVELTDFFFNRTGFAVGKDKDVLEYNKELLRWKDMTDEEIVEALDKLEEVLSKIDTDDFDKKNLEQILMPIADSRGDRGKLLWPFRVALTGKKSSAGPFEIAEILGKEKVINRIREAARISRQ